MYTAYNTVIELAKSKRNADNMADAKYVLPNGKPKISIIGTGEFGSALARRLLMHGYDVTMGSENPQSRIYEEEPLSCLRVCSLSDCIAASSIVFLATHEHKHGRIYRFTDALRGKILVDVSNTYSGHAEDSSNASRLASVLTYTAVIKSFNTLSAWAIGNEMEIPGVVYVCGEQAWARGAVAAVARGAGFPAVEIAGLRHARRLELRNHRGCSGDWARATVAMVIVFVSWLVYAATRYHYLKEHPYTPGRFPSNVMNKVFGCSSLTLLAVTYLPGCLAAFHQLCHGTKHRKFPKGLDQWMKIRKQLGIYAMMFGLLHMVLSILLISPAYYGSLFHTEGATVPLNRTTDIMTSHGSRMNYKGETAIFLGVVAIGLMVLLGITSLHDVGRRLNPVQWRALHTYLGLACLVIAVSHPMVMSMSKWLVAPPKGFLSLKFIVCILPWVVILLKLITLIPWVQWRLEDIRSGRIGGRVTSEAHTAKITITPHSNNAFVGEKSTKTEIQMF